MFWFLSLPQLFHHVTARSFFSTSFHSAPVVFSALLQHFFYLLVFSYVTVCLTSRGHRTPVRLWRQREPGVERKKTWERRRNKKAQACIVTNLKHSIFQFWGKTVLRNHAKLPFRQCRASPWPLSVAPGWAAQCKRPVCGCTETRVSAGSLCSGSYHHQRDRTTCDITMLWVSKLCMWVCGAVWCGLRLTSSQSW